MADVRIVFPDGLTPKQMRRVADIADAVEPLGAIALIDAKLFDLDPARCPCCDRTLEAGHCYACRPMFGYGEAYRCEKCRG